MSKWMKKEERLGHIGGKVCVYGTQGTGKSTFAGTFPRINLVDAEDGQTYYLAENENILNILPTTSASEVQEALEELSDEDILETYDSIVIDSGTKLNENMQAAAYEIVENRARKQKMSGKDIDLDDLNLSMRDWGHIKRWNQQLATSYILFSNLGKWTVVTAHEKDVTKEIKKANGEVDRIVIGNKPDLAKKAEHDFDILLRMYTEIDSKGEIKFLAEVKKDRTNVTKVGQILENPSFALWQPKWESTRKLGIKKVDMSGDVGKSAHSMEAENNEMETLVDNFKTKMKSLEKPNQVKVTKKLQDLKITNPLRTDDLDGMRAIAEFMELL